MGNWFTQLNGFYKKKRQCVWGSFGWGGEVSVAAASLGAAATAAVDVAAAAGQVPPQAGVDAASAGGATGRGWGQVQGHHHVNVQIY